MSRMLTIIIVLLLRLGALDAREISRKESAQRNAFEEVLSSEEAVDNGFGTIRADKRATCSASFQKVGCYKDDNHQALSVLLFQDTDASGAGYSGQKVDWANYDSYLQKLVCRCATAAQAQGYTHFGLQNYGACYSAADASRHYADYGSSNACLNNYYAPCVDNSANQCVGASSDENYVYIITDEGSGQAFAYDANTES